MDRISHCFLAVNSLVDHQASTNGNVRPPVFDAAKKKSETTQTGATVTGGRNDNSFAEHSKSIGALLSTIDRETSDMHLKLELIAQSEARTTLARVAQAVQSFDNLEKGMRCTVA